MRQTALLAGLCLWTASVFAANSQLMNLVMPNAKILAGVNVTTAKTTPFGQFLLARIAAQPTPPLVAATGFDPRADLTELLFASAADPSGPGGLALALGTFNTGEIGTAAAKQNNTVVQTYDGYPLIVTTNPKAKVAHAVAFVGSSIAIAGDESDVKAALDRSNGTNPIVDNALADEVSTLSENNDVWIASSVGLPANKKLQALQAIQSFEGGVTFGTTVAASGQAIVNTPQNAAALASVIQLLVIGDSSTNGALSRLLQNLKATVTDSTLGLSLSISEAQLEALINALGAQRPAQPSGQAGARRRPVR